MAPAAPDGSRQVSITEGPISDHDMAQFALMYVPDVDAAYARALQHGATSMAAPGDKPYQERSAGVRGSFGNVWWISTYRA